MERAKETSGRKRRAGERDERASYPNSRMVCGTEEGLSHNLTLSAGRLFKTKHRMALSTRFMKALSTLPVKKVSEIYFNNTNIASQVSKEILKVANSRNSFIIEISPGHGLVTQELIASNIPRLAVFERSDSPNFEHLNNLVGKSQAKLLPLFKNDSPLTAISRVCENRSIGDIKLEDGVGLIGLFPNHPRNEAAIVALLLSDLIFRKGFFSHEMFSNLMFFVVSDRFLQSLRPPKNRMTYRHVLYNSLLSIQVVLSFDYTNVSPQVRIPRKDTYDCRIAHLVRISVNEQTLQVLKPTQLEGFRLFLKQAFVPKSDGLLPFIK